MSLIVYEVLTAQPDFTDPPAFGIEDDRDTTNSPGGRSFAAWTGHTDRVLRFDFQTTSAEEWRNLREFIDRMSGRAGAFFLPSWQHDFELATDAAPGDLQLRLAGHWFADNVTENRPDTLGRVLFTVNHLGQFATHLVTNFGEDGANDVVGLYRPITSEMEAGRTVVGFCYLARLATDNVESVHLSPDHARTTLGFRAITQTRRLSQQESAEGTAIGSLKPNFDIVATDEDLILFDSDTYEATGPFVLNVPQTDNFQSDWIARLSVATNTVKITGPAFEYTPALYDAPGPAVKIALAFDATSQEVLAWEHDGMVRIGWTTGAGIQRLSFAGLSPVAYNTFAIDSTVNAGTATLAVFYLKQQDSTIYCRIASESFATERRYCISPLAPLRLFTARRAFGRIELVGIDAGHRLARWRSQTYVTPLEIQIALAAVEELSGNYRAITVFAFGEEETQAQAAVEPLTGTYVSVLVQSLGNEGGAARGSVDGEVTGIYLSVLVQSLGNGDRTSGLVLPATGTYSLVRKLAEAEETTLATIQPLTGTYGP